MEKIRENAIVVCIGKNGMSPTLETAAAGWKKDYCVKIGRVDNHKQGISILWPEDGGFGIYDDTVRLATVHEVEKYNELGYNYFISDFRWNTLEDIMFDLDKKILQMEEKEAYGRH